MSTQCSVSHINGENWEWSLYAYTEYFDPNDGPLYLEAWEQGDEANVDVVLEIPRKQAIEWIRELQRWADKAEKEQSDETDSR